MKTWAQRHKPQNIIKSWEFTQLCEAPCILYGASQSWAKTSDIRIFSGLWRQAQADKNILYSGKDMAIYVTNSP